MSIDHNTKLTYIVQNNIIIIGTNDRQQHANANPNCDCSSYLIIPEQISQKFVEEIGDSAFRYHSTLTKVVIPKTVKKIGWDGFAYCDKLKEVTF